MQLVTVVEFRKSADGTDHGNGRRTVWVSFIENINIRNPVLRYEGVWTAGWLEGQHKNVMLSAYYCRRRHTDIWQCYAKNRPTSWSSVRLNSIRQGCSLGLERLGLEAGLEGSTSRSRLGFEDITSRSRVSGFVTLGLVNIHAMHQACRYIRKKIMDLTRKKQVVKWQTSPVINCDTAVSRRSYDLTSCGHPWYTSMPANVKATPKWSPVDEILLVPTSPHNRPRMDNDNTGSDIAT